MANGAKYEAGSHEALPSGYGKEVTYYKSEKSFPNLAKLPSDAVASYNSSETNITSQTTAKVVKTEWVPQYFGWSKPYAYPNSEQKCKPPVILSITAGVTYKLEISASGDIRLVKVNGTIGGTLTGSFTGSLTYQACAEHQKIEIQRFLTYKQIAYYSDNTSKPTGGISNIRQPGQYGDITFRQLSSWSAIKK